MSLQFTHHGAVRGVTGSCHQLTLPGGASVRVDSMLRWHPASGSA